MDKLIFLYTLINFHFKCKYLFDIHIDDYYEIIKRIIRLYGLGRDQTQDF
jgi:hypothetical protein